MNSAAQLEELMIRATRSSASGCSASSARYAARRAVARELGRERGPVGEAHHARDAAAVCGVFRQVVALRIVQVLQTVLDAAQEDIGLLELPGCGLRQLMLFRQQAQNRQRRPHRE